MLSGAVEGMGKERGDPGTTCFFSGVGAGGTQRRYIMPNDSLRPDVDIS